MPAGPYGPGGFGAWLGRALDARDAGRELPFALVLNETGEAIGTTRFGNVSLRDERLEIGWTWIARAHQRTVANTEMKRLLLLHAFDELGAERVTLKTGSLNEASRRAIERLGAVEEGVLRRARAARRRLLPRHGLLLDRGRGVAGRARAPQRLIR